MTGDLPTAHRETAEHRQYERLLGLSPGLEERLNTGSEGDLRYIADMVIMLALPGYRYVLTTTRR